MNAKDLCNLKSEVQQLISKHLDNTGKTPSALAKEAGIHPAQLLLFMSGQRGLTDSSLMRLGEVIK